MAKKNTTTPMQHDEMQELRRTAAESLAIISQLRSDISLLQRERQALVDQINLLKSENAALLRQISEMQEEAAAAARDPEGPAKEVVPMYEVIWDIDPKLKLRLPPMFPGGIRAKTWRDDNGYWHAKLPIENAEKIIATPESNFKLVSGADSVEVSYSDGLYMQKRVVRRHRMITSPAGRTEWIPVVIEDSETKFD
jgi:hypothetical protein